MIRIITIAPELPGALRVIEACREQGILVHMGHSDATYLEASEGKKAGATGITHLFNAMRPFHHREPGIAGFALFDSLAAAAGAQRSFVSQNYSGEQAI